MHHQRACRKEPARGSPLGRYAGRPPLTPGLKLEIRPYRADARSVSGSTPPANEGDVARIGGLDRRHVAGRNRSTFPGAWDEANVRYPPLIGHSGTASTPLLTLQTDAHRLGRPRANGRGDRLRGGGALAFPDHLAAALNNTDRGLLLRDVQPDILFHASSPQRVRWH